MSNNTNMTIKDLKEILKDLPDDMPVVIPVIDEDDVNTIYGFRYVRTAGILFDGYGIGPDLRVFVLNGSKDGVDISTQIKTRDTVICEKVLY